VPAIYEFEGLRRDGSTIALMNSAHRVEWDGRPAFQVILTDMTGLKRAERHLAESNRMLQQVLDTIPVRVFWKDSEGRFLGCNQLFALDAGRDSAADLIGCTDDEMSWHTDAARYRADDRAVMSSGHAKLTYEEEHTTPDGRPIWVRMSRVPLRNADGAIDGMLGTYEHITEQKLAEQALRASEERYALAVRGSTDGVWDWDIARGDDLLLSPVARDPRFRVAAPERRSRRGVRPHPS
jgi:PAS domain S-box-containing protein